MTDARSLTIVIAVEDAEQNLPAILESLAPSENSHIEFIVIFTPGDPNTASLVATDHVRLHQMPRGSRIPMMWADGFALAAGHVVVTTTAHCVPRSDWLDRLQRLDLSEAAAVGGAIENSSDASPMDWAIFILRYVNYTTENSEGQAVEIAADNAAYRRSLVMEYPRLLAGGFWEPRFHAEFRARAIPMYFEPALRVVHRNRYSARGFCAQRRKHGFEFGSGRACDESGLRHALLLLACPILPVFFLLKILRRARRQPTLRPRIGRALPWLAWFVLHWGIGEALGYYSALFSRSGDRV